MNIRSLIREEIQKIVDKKELEDKLTQDISYLKGFILNKKEEKNNNIVWVFEHTGKSYTLRFYIRYNKKTSNWSAKLFIYWKLDTLEFTEKANKEFEQSYGPFSSYNDMVDELNRKLKNNPILSLDNYLDDNNHQFSNDIIIMIQLLLKKGKKLESVKNTYFKDLKKIYDAIKDIKSIDEIEKYVDEKYPLLLDKQTFLLTLQKLYQLDFHLKKEELENLF